MLLTYFFYFLNVQMNILFDLYSDSGVCGLEKSEILFLIIKLCFSNINLVLIDQFKLLKNKQTMKWVFYARTHKIEVLKSKIWQAYKNCSSTLGISSFGDLRQRILNVSLSPAADARMPSRQGSELIFIFCSYRPGGNIFFYIA